MLKDRQKDILEAVVREYIRTAKPVASRDLAETFSYDISPATIRNELGILSDLEYLEKPHTSAGRIPTDLAYRFFVDHLIHPSSLTSKERESLDELLLIRKQNDFLRVLGKTLTGLCGAFAAAATVDERHIHIAGLAKILKEPEFKERRNLQTFIRFIEALDEKLYDVVDAWETYGRETIFIGRENPFEDADDYTVMITEWQHPAGFEGFVALVGPMRMNYQKNIAVMNHIRNFFDQPE